MLARLAAVMLLVAPAAAFAPPGAHLVAARAPASTRVAPQSPIMKDEFMEAIVEPAVNLLPIALPAAVVGVIAIDSTP